MLVYMLYSGVLLKMLKVPNNIPCALAAIFEKGKLLRFRAYVPATITGSKSIKFMKLSIKNYLIFS